MRPKTPPSHPAGEDLPATHPPPRHPPAPLPPPGETPPPSCPPDPPPGKTRSHSCQHPGCALEPALTLPVLHWEALGWAGPRDALRVRRPGVIAQLPHVLGHHVEEESDEALGADTGHWGQKDRVSRAGSETDPSCFGNQQPPCSLLESGGNTAQPTFLPGRRGCPRDGAMELATLLSWALLHPSDSWGPTWSLPGPPCPG